MTKIFATGVTGYIGGDALFAIAAAHPEYEITALVRNTHKGAKVAKEYPNIRLVYGDLDDADLIEKESKDADVVCHWAQCDHEASVKAIIKGLFAHDPSKPGFLIHTSGTGNLTFEDIFAGTFGTAFREKVYDDLEGVKDVTSLPDGAPYRNVEKAVLEAGTNHADRVKTAIVCPSTIYGLGRGPDNQRSIQLPELCRITLEDGQAFKVNEGKTKWNHVYIQDLSVLYLRLVEEAAAGGASADWSGKPQTWGAEGYYFGENGEHIWGKVSQWVADEAKKQGYISTAEVKSFTAEEANEKRMAGPVLWGGNSRCRGKRAGAVLGWKPSGGSLREDVKTSLEYEAKRLGMRPGHAEVAAGDA